MKFIKVGLSVDGFELYVDAACNKRATIQQKILDGAKALKNKKARDSVPPQWRPKDKNDMGDILNTFFGGK